MHIVRSPKDFYAGLIYLGFGLAGLWFGAAYPMGTAGRMGAGYFPKVLSGLLVVLGLLALYRGLRIEGAAVGAIRWKPLFLILAGCSLFGLLLQPLGMPIALFVLILCCAMASREFRWELRALAGAVGIVAICALVFIKGLSVQMPLVGDWLIALLGNG
jgi:hypothetical protein